MSDKSTEDCITHIGDVLMEAANTGDLAKVDEIISALTSVMRVAMETYSGLHSGEIH